MLSVCNYKEEGTHKYAVAGVAVEVCGRVGGEAESLVGNGHVGGPEGERIDSHLPRHHALAVVYAEPVCS